MSHDVRELKRALRRELTESSRRFPAEERARQSRELCRRLADQAAWREAGAVLLFAPMPVEPDIRPLVRQALAAEKALALPRFVAQAGAYEICQVTSWEADVSPGHYGILEPRSACPVFPVNRLDFVLVPGLGFDADGWRLGRGKGYYDRLLAGIRGMKCGIAFEWQVVPMVPVEPHDVRLNCILTPTRWLGPSAAGGF